jgi:phosphopantetheinyl transferase (holo-ACP synthase)
MLLVKQKSARHPGRALLRGVGVDLVSCGRVKQFLSRHGEYVRERFLNSSERRSYKRLSPKAFAELFTAKEAFFKACGEAWMGLEGFQDMRMKRGSGDHFEMEWRPARVGKFYRGEGHFFRSGDLVGAQAMIWR